jgi:hypothetical protein
MNHRKREINVTIERPSAYFLDRISGLITGTSLSLAFALVGAILGMAIQT